MNSDLTAFIFARGGSKGVPQKNIRMLSGKPLIAYSINAALACHRVAKVVVSTDDEAIAEIARQYGAEVPFMRPKELAEDDSPEWLAWRHAIEFMNNSSEFPNIGTFVSLPATSPLRNVEDIDGCLDAFERGNTDMVVTVKGSERHPSFNMVTIAPDGDVRLVLPVDRPISRRQDARPVFDLTTVAYVASPQFILNKSSLFEGRVRAVTVPRVRALDIDTELDFQFAEFILERRSGDGVETL
jgi:N-acylneuraminate cytidylyltransferase